MTRAELVEVRSKSAAYPLVMAVLNTLSVIAFVSVDDWNGNGIGTTLIGLLAVWYWLDFGRVVRARIDARTILALDPDLQPKAIEALPEDAHAAIVATLPDSIRGDFDREEQLQRENDRLFAQLLERNAKAREAARQEAVEHGWEIAEIMRFGEPDPVRVDVVTPYDRPVKSFLFYVQTDDGVEVCSTSADVAKVGDVVAEFVQYPTRRAVRIRQGSKTLVAGVADRDASMKFGRVPAGDKTARAILKPVKEVSK